MRVVVITSCTGEKAVTHERALTLEDFKGGEEAVRAREVDLAALVTPAEAIYTGQQHVRLMRGVRAVREEKNGGIDIDLHVLSAGYGLIPADRRVAPYECTFQGMKKNELRTWADQLNVPGDVRQLLAQPHDLALILLGDPYLEACQIDDTVQLRGPTLVFCGTRIARKLPALKNMRVITMNNKEAKRFSCGVIALKGEMGARVLEELAHNPTFLQRLKDEDENVLDLLERDNERTAKKKSSAAKANPDVDYVIHIPQEWWAKPHRQKLRYFIPDWDDQVDRDFDFESETHSGGIGGWSNQVYAHQLYQAPTYDGILVSRVVAEKGKAKKKRVNKLGIHRALRVPDSFPVLGDCGAFDYIEDEVPPFKTDELLDYYTRLKFNYGVSIDHLIVKATEDQRHFRYGLTIENAQEFIREHKAQGLPWEPIGAVQGWDPASYADAARQIAGMGYNYIALGGLVRTSTEEIGRVLEAVHDAIPTSVAIHLFGIARFEALPKFVELGVRSVDSASPLRRAWLSARNNYWTIDGTQYSAIRIPEVGKSFRSKRIVEEGRASERRLLEMEKRALALLRAYDRHEANPDTVLDALDEYDSLISPERSSMREQYRLTLEARPWASCPCDICQRNGVEVVIFRGNNRNRRRGFHNTYVFYHLMQRELAGQHIEIHKAAEKHSNQLVLFEN